MAKVNAQNVHETLKKHILADGFEVVLDLKKSQGTKIYDSKDGKYYYDFFTCVASIPIGYNHPKMKTPEFMEKLITSAINKPSLSDIYPQEMAEFLEVFSRVAMPAYLPHAFFVEGGALGVENALKTAFDWKMRKNLERGFYKGLEDESKMVIIHFRQSFHGRTGYTLSLTNTEPVKIDYYPKFKWPRIDNPKVTFPLNEENLAKVKKIEENAVNQIKQAIKEYGHNIASLIIEPIQGEGGDNHFRNEFFSELRKICDENEIFFIIDEVQTGIGLTGRMWCHQHFDFKPDAIAFGKKTQVCGTLVGKRVDEVKDNVFVVSSRLNSTWGGNLVDMVRSQRYLEIIEEDKLVDNARNMGEYLLGKLFELQGEFSGKVTNSRGRGLFCAFDLPDKDTKNNFTKAVIKNGLIILGCGESSIRFRPSLTITKEEIDEGMNIIKKSLKEVLK
jgi:L-lysine 6-transaminase